ncbi:hypothetical protein SUGI_0679000 [Cryptomeria japonica]|uniref:LOB domain-containing protein 1 n=1 Tax=Cryptomeria japonica TaxID=3369 RepID=UPI0024148BA2|nr:LOB domain-containing protein 1 [Cryptomeria japonica]GLJ33780.1 hypothetical protein SUGI_0679000 [Cryptomeria japonica]
MAKRQRTSVSCAACRLTRKKCSEDCILAPHFPAYDPDKFTVVHRVYGTNNIVKLLQGLETKQRVDAVNSLVSEASARVNNPILGSVKVVNGLEKQIAELESELATKQEELVNMHSEYDKLLLLLHNRPLDVQDVYHIDTTEDIMYEQVDTLLWEPI